MKKYIYVLIVSLIFIVLLFKANSDTAKVKEDIKLNYTQGKAIVYKYFSNRSVNRYYYKFKYNGKWYNNSESLTGYDGDSCVGKRYVVVFSSRNPNNSMINLDKEVN